MPEIVFKGKEYVYNHHLTVMFADESLTSVGGLELVGQAQSLLCDLVFNGDWRGTLNARQFQPMPL